METAGSGARGTQRFVVTEAERRLADLWPIEVAPELARATVQAVPFSFHTFALNRPEGIDTPGVARDHRYRVAMLPADFAGMRVLDVDRFDGFYAFLPERRGAERVVAVVNEQYRLWVASRWGIKLAAERDFARIIPCWARRSGIGGWTRSRSTVSTRVSLRQSSSGGEPAGAVACAAWPDGQPRDGADRDVRAWPGAAGRCRDSGLPAGEVYARDEFVYGRSGTPASSGLPGSRVSQRSGRSTRAGCRPPTDHRATGRLTAPRRRPHDLFTSWSQTRNVRGSAVSQIGDRASGDRRAPPRPRLWPGLIARGA